MLQQEAILSSIKCLWKWNAGEVSQSVIKDIGFIHKTFNILFDYLALYIFYSPFFFFLFMRSLKR